ncbi:MAG: hypothetical protein IPH20_21855 [Bacteroidales bacterium]|nr:hypothetical protein [Bacteroidales bacterium]
MDLYFRQRSGHPAAAHGGAYNACLKDNTSADNKTLLITPPMNLSGLINPSLQFWHTQAYWSPDQDELKVFYKPQFRYMDFSCKPNQ